MNKKNREENLPGLFTSLWVPACYLRFQTFPGWARKVG